MLTFIHIFLVLPIIAFLVSCVFPKKWEQWISGWAYFSIGLHLLLILIWVGYWILNGMSSVPIKEFSVFKSTDYDFYIAFYFDKVTHLFLLLGALLTFVITYYSKYYLHRESGYKRFFNVMLLFYIGYNLIVCSGNLETLFIGWEILGVSSFLLIAYYRDRYLPVKNALKVFSIYRIGDVGLILAMWLSHHLWHQNVSFDALHNKVLVHQHITQHSYVGFAIAFFILLSAGAKSAQWPFSFWLPRAMEGPTPSSAIFYGSLSVHIGAFILLRTYPFWENQLVFKIVLAFVGALTCIIAHFSARVQATIKSQIAYASISQIGLIFIEIALGWHLLALIHIAGNAFLRTYQLLVSPSIVAYKIKEQLYQFVPRPLTIEDSWSKKIESTLYILSIKEWFLDDLLNYWVWRPFKIIGSKWKFLTFKNVFAVFGSLLFIGILIRIYGSRFLGEAMNTNFSLFYGFLGLLMVIKAYTERNSVRVSWSLIIINHFCIALAISFNEYFENQHHYWYLSGVVVCGAIGLACIQRLRKLEKWVSLDRFYGHIKEHPKIGLGFLICSIALAGFPITPTFIGEDLIFSHIHEDQILLAAFIALSMILNGLAAIRIYSRIFLGPHAPDLQHIVRGSN